METLEDIEREHDDWQEALLDDYRKRITAANKKASSAVIAALLYRLDISGGVINYTANNRDLFRKVASLYRRELKGAGFFAATSALVAAFPSQLPYFERALDAASASLNRRLPVTVGKQAARALSSIQETTRESLTETVNQTAIAGKKAALAMLGGATNHLIENLQSSFDRLVGQATNVADTAASVYYRTYSDSVFISAEKRLKGTLMYRYTGPFDRINRPFCHQLASERSTLYTRAEIMAMDNGQRLPVMTCCGGYRCRHRWTVGGIR